MEKVDRLFVENPLIYSDLKKYLWFKDNVRQKEEAVALFWHFLVKEIYIEGFATDEEGYIGEKAFNKPIVDIRKLNRNKNIVFMTGEYGQKICDICQTVTLVNPVVNNDKMIIFGAGKYGTEVYEQLTRRGLGERIIFFIDSDETKCGGEKSKEGLAIHNIDFLAKVAEDVWVVEAAQAHEEMEKIMREKKVVQRRLFYTNEHNERLKLMYHYEDTIKFGISYVSELCTKLTGKNIYYYGERDALTEKTGRCLQLLDFNFCGFLLDESKHMVKGDYLVEDILYSEDFFILLDNHYNREERERLRELGLELGIDYNLIDCCGYTTNMDNLMLDLNLGYSYKEGEKYPGFVVYGEENENDYKVVTLGASTTDGNINWDKSWPCFLYERISEKKKVTVYNGGIAGYSSGQELIKLIRDVIPLKPDLVIVYDGHIDIGNTDTRKPYAFPYLEKIFKFAGENMNGLTEGIETDTGIVRMNTAFENWLSNIEIMQAVTSLRGIRFLSFIQPSRLIMGGSKVDRWRFSHISFWLEGYLKPYLDFKREIQDRRIEDSHEYITDLTGIFDDNPEVYMDAVHVYEKGNEIIADAIVGTIYEKIFCD